MSITLTPEQEALIPVWREKWIAIGYNTAPTHKAKGEMYLRDVLRVEKKNDQVPILWVKSPLIMCAAGCMAIAFHNHLSVPVVDALSIALTPVANRDSATTRTSTYEWYETWIKDLAHLAIELGGMTAKERTEAIKARRATSCFSINAFKLLEQQIAQLNDPELLAMPDKVKKFQQWKKADIVNKLSTVVAENWHQHQSNSRWLGYQCYQSFAREVCKVTLPPDLETAAVAYQGVSEYVPWWMPTTAFVLACDRPEIFVAENFDLSCRTGPALRWRDGSESYFIDGYLVPEHVVNNPNSISVEEIRKQENAEIKRLFIEQLGWSEYALRTGGKVIDMHEASSQDGKTKWMECVMEIEDYRVLMTVDPSTGRAYALEINPEIDTCVEAQKYLLGTHNFNHVKLDLGDNIYPVVRT